MGRDIRRKIESVSFKKGIDLVVLNGAKAILADEIIRKGEPIIIKDEGILNGFFMYYN